MFSQEHRLRHEKDIKALFSRGKSAFGLTMAVKFKPNHLDVNRFAIVIGVKVAKRAVVRNRLRRQIRGILSSYIAEMTSGFDVAILPKKGAIGKKSSELERELLDTLRKKTPLLS